MSYIGHLWIPVSNLDKSLEFYKQKLGLKEAMTVRLDDEDADPNLKNAFSILLTADEKLSFILVESAETLAGKGRIVPGWVVENLAGTRQSLEKKGVEFIGDVIDFGMFQYIHFKDPDNNLFQLTEINKDE